MAAFLGKAIFCYITKRYFVIENRKHIGRTASCAARSSDKRRGEQSSVCRTYKRKEISRDECITAWRYPLGIMCQDTPLITRHPDVRLSILIILKGIRKKAFPRKAFCLPGQKHREDILMYAQRPIAHSFVESAAFFVFLGDVPGAEPLQAIRSHRSIGANLFEKDLDI